MSAEEAQRIRHSIRNSKVFRQTQLANFPVTVTRLAADMRRLIENGRQRGNLGEVECQLLDSLEGQLRTEYARSFGLEPIGLIAVCPECNKEVFVWNDRYIWHGSIDLVTGPACSLSGVPVQRSEEE